MKTLETGIVVYGASADKLRKLKRWASDLGSYRTLVVENKSGMATGDVIQGSNEYSEFSAYLDLCVHFSGQGPFVIVNDTLIKTHWTWAWNRLVRIALKKFDPNRKGVCGDIRIENHRIEGRPDFYLSSWIFILPNREALKAFESALLHAIHQPHPVTPAYDAWLNQWLEPGSLLKGWHRKTDEAEKKRKRSCIIIEHNLSMLIPTYGLEIISAGQYSPAFYQIIRLADRLKTRYKAIMPYP